MAEEEGKRAEEFNNAVVDNNNYNTSSDDSADGEIKMCLSFSPEEDGGTASGSLTLDQTSSQQQQLSPVETTGQLSSENQPDSEQLVPSIVEVKENTTLSSTTTDGADAPQADGLLCLKDCRTLSSSVTLDQAISCQSSVETTGQLSMQEVIVASNDEDEGNQLHSEQLSTSIMEENTTVPPATTDSDDAQQADGLCLKTYQTLSVSVTLDPAISCQSSVETTGQVSMQEVIIMSNDEDVTSKNQPDSEQLIRSIMDDKENTMPSTPGGDGVQPDDSPRLEGPEAPVGTPTKHDHDAELVKRAQEEGCVDVVFPGTVTQEGCCRFVHEILKCVLYQRQQLPMTYDQLKHSQKCQASKQNKEVASWRPVHSVDMGWRKSERSLQELDMLLEQLDVLFSLSLVPRVLLLLGGSVVLPKELYEINMEALILSSGDKSLRVSSCLRQLFRTLFVTDLLSDTAPVRLQATTVLVLAHRECGVGWFRPKLGFKVPTRVKRRMIVLSTDADVCRDLQTTRSDWTEYVWFQAPAAIKGFSS